MEVIQETLMAKEERERMVLLLAMCKLMKINARAGLIYGALMDAENEIEEFDRATDEEKMKPHS